jgi:hypothetical protein
MYSEKEMDELVDKMVTFLETHNVFELMELVTAAVATKEMANSDLISVSVNIT